MKNGLINVIDNICPLQLTSVDSSKNYNDATGWYLDDVDVWIYPKSAATTSWDWYINDEVSNCSTKTIEYGGETYCYQSTDTGYNSIRLPSNINFPTRRYYIKVRDIFDKEYFCPGQNQYKIDSYKPDVYIAISEENNNKYGSYLDGFMHSVDYQDDFIAVNKKDRGGYFYSEPYQTYATEWKSTGANSFTPLAAICGGSGCSDFQYLGCATNSDSGEKWYTGGKKGTWSDMRINDYYNNVLGISGTKRFYIYRFKICSNAGICSEDWSAGYELYSGNKDYYICEYE